MKFESITPLSITPVAYEAASSWPRRAASAALKTLLGLAVFVGILAGWLAYEFYQERHSPLPNGAIGSGERCALWFVGSSSMHKWVTLQSDMKPWNAHNRGVDGAKVEYLADRFESDLPTHAPAAIVLYAGENDLAWGASPAAVLQSLRRIIAAKRARYGALPIFYVSIKPSPTRWRFRPQQAEVNRVMANDALNSRDLRFVDIVPAMLVDGRPGPFYQEDGVHLSPNGYRRWGRAVHRALHAHLPAELVRSCDGLGI
ncbi:MAG: GDSL-type esterase/lipase family protein, partial [Rhizorhabdus sp.]